MSRDKPLVLVDLDQEVFNIEDVMIEIHNSFAKNPLSRYTWLKYSIDENPGMEKNDKVKIIEIIAEKRLFRTMPLIPYTKEGLNFLDSRYDVWFSTVRHLVYPQAALDTLYALDSNGFNASHTIFSEDKPSLVKKFIEKGMKPRFFIEDYLKYALPISELCPVLVFDYPYNRDYDRKNKNIIAVRGFEDYGWWHNLINVVDKLEENKNGASSGTL